MKPSMTAEDRAKLQAELDAYLRDKGMTREELAAKTREVLARLTPREERVLRMRFGIGEECDLPGMRDAAE